MIMSFCTRVGPRAYYIVLEREISGLDTAMCGEMLSRNIETLDSAARQLGVRPLSEFISMDPKVVEDFLGDDAAGLPIPPLREFSVEEGLATVRGLLTRAEAESARDDLQNCERILRVAAEHGVRWHLQWIHDAR